jgi:hypothetical protein
MVNGTSTIHQKFTCRGAYPAPSVLAHCNRGAAFLIMLESSNFSRKRLLAGVVVLLSVGVILEPPIGNALRNRDPNPAPDQTITINISQDWQLHPGDTIAGHHVAGGLGDISIELKSGGRLNLGGTAVYAPFAGKVRIDQRQCLYYSAAAMPNQMLRLCGLRSRRLGSVAAAQPIGHGTTLQLATLRQQPNRKWAIVEPDKTLIEKLLKAP